MKPHNTHVLQPLSLYRLKCLFRFLYVVLRFGGRSADFRTVTNAAQSDLVFFFPTERKKRLVLLKYNFHEAPVAYFLEKNI